MRTVVFTNKKSGVGKSTISVSLAGALADLRLKVLYIDIDHQGTATNFLSSQNINTGLVEFIANLDTNVITETEHSKTLAEQLDFIVNNDPRNELRLFFSGSYFPYLQFRSCHQTS